MSVVIDVSSVVITISQQPLWLESLGGRQGTILGRETANPSMSTVVNSAQDTSSTKAWLQNFFFYALLVSSSNFHNFEFRSLLFCAFSSPSLTQHFQCHRLTLVDSLSVHQCMVCIQVIDFKSDFFFFLFTLSVIFNHLAVIWPLCFFQSSFSHALVNVISIHRNG